MDIIRKYADAGDIVNLRYVFSGAFDADPTFEQYEDDYQYCKRKGVLEGHREMTPLTDDATRWTEDYWYKVQGDLQKNLSDKRLTHMKKMARVVFKDKVKLLNAERAAKKRPSAPPPVSTPDAFRPTAARQTGTAPSDFERQIERENQRVEEEMRRANQAYEEKQRQRRADEERRQRTSEKRRADARDAESDGASPKKALGIAAIALILILLAILLAMFLGNKSSRNPQTNLSDQTNVATLAPEQNLD